MGVHYSYKCTKATKTSVVATYGNRTAVLCDLEFQDEHGHKLEPIRDVLVVVEDGRASLAKYPENVVPEDYDPAEFGRIDALCKNHPGYDVYNEEEFSAWLV